MDIEKEILEGCLKLKISGKINSVTAPTFEKAVLDDINVIEKICVDFAETSFISSAGLRVFMKAYQTLNTPGSITVLNVNEEIQEVFDMTMFSDFLVIE